MKPIFRHPVILFLHEINALVSFKILESRQFLQNKSRNSKEDAPEFGICPPNRTFYPQVFQSSVIMQVPVFNCAVFQMHTLLLSITY